MSHLVCPLCCFNRPIENFDPNDYPLDLKLRKWHGLGYARGFEYEDFSVLGDETYSPLFANRTLDIMRMFIDAGTLSIEDILPKLGYPNLFNQLKNSMDLNNNLRNVNQELNKRMNYIKYVNHSLTRELNDKKERKVIENNITKIMFSIRDIEGINCKIMYEDETVKLIINNLEDCHHDFFGMFLKMKKEEWKDLLKRLIPGNSQEKMYLDTMSMFNRLKKGPVDELLYMVEKKRQLDIIGLDSSDVFYTEKS